MLRKKTINTNANIEAEAFLKRKLKINKRTSRVRGMKDVLFEEAKYWDLIYKKAEDLSKFYGFGKIDIPVIEFMDLYERSTGKATDIVTKEMYSLVDKSGDRMALRPEATPGLARAYIEHGLFNLPQPVKTFWFGPLFRHDRPQAGRTRQHTQINLDIFGEESPVADFILILIAYNFFRELQIPIQVQVNSIGCPECRGGYLDELKGFYRERGKRSKMCNDCRKRFDKNPLRLLDCKEKDCIEIREDAPQIVDFICDPCKNHFIRLLEYLDELDISYNLNPYLVRGLDYYTKTVFEFWPIDSEGQPDSSLSLGGGGRYDQLLELMGGRPTPACGFGIGVERTVLKVKEADIPLKKDDKDVVFITQLGDQARMKAIKLFEELRKAGFNVKQAFTKDSLKAQLEEANKANAKLTVIMGQKEIINKTALLREMESGVQEVIDFKKIHSEINRRLANGS